jgi:hypothetical protein
MLWQQVLLLLSSVSSTVGGAATNAERTHKWLAKHVFRSTSCPRVERRGGQMSPKMAPVRQCFALFIRMNVRKGGVCTGVRSSR